GEDRPGQDSFRQGDLSEVAEEVVERHGPGVQMQEPGMPTQVDVDVIVIAHPYRLSEPGHPEDPEDPEGDDPRRPHPYDPGLDPAPGQSVHDAPRDGRLSRSVRSHDCVDPSDPSPKRLACGHGIRRFRAAGLAAMVRHGIRSIVISVVLQHGAAVNRRRSQSTKHKGYRTWSTILLRLHGARLFQAMNQHGSW